MTCFLDYYQYIESDTGESFYAPVPCFVATDAVSTALAKVIDDETSSALCVTVKSNI